MFLADDRSTGKADDRDVIPRVSVDQILGTLGFLAAKERSSFDEVRIRLREESTKRSPPTRESMWTTARDALGELQRLGFAKVGPIPRRRSEVERLRGSPCEATPEGRSLAALLSAKRGAAFDALLVAWVNRHPYFQTFLRRLALSPLYIPDITSVKQVGEFDGSPASAVASRIRESVVGRLRQIGWTENRLGELSDEINARAGAALAEIEPASLRSNVKAWVDLIQDSIVLPAFLAAEKMPFDPVTFQHIVRVAQQFLAAAWTASHPKFPGRVAFSTCDFVPSIPSLAGSPGVVQEVSHHGKTWASGRFAHSLANAYASVSQERSGYVDVYHVRALVCLDLGIQPRVFELCLSDFAKESGPSHPAVYTELPMRPPPAGESYVELAGQRIGLLKLVR